MKKHTENDNACQYTGTKLNKSRSFSVRDGVMCDSRVVRREKLLVKREKEREHVHVCVCVCVCVCVYIYIYSKMMFLTPSHQGTYPQIMKLQFPTQTWGPKQKHK